MILGWLVLPDQQKLWVGHASVLVNIQLRDTLLGFRHLKCKMFLHELYYWNALHKQWSSCRQKLVKAEVWRWKATLRQRAKSGRSSAAGGLSSDGCRSSQQSRLCNATTLTTAKSAEDAFNKHSICTWLFLSLICTCIIFWLQIMISLYRW